MSTDRLNWGTVISAGRAIGVVAAAAVLSACWQSDTEELSTWVADQRKQQRVRIDPIAAPKQFVPQTFTAADSVDPYNAQRLSAALKRELKPAGDGSALIKPEMARQAQQKQPLEGPPLDAMAFIGQFVKDGVPVALIRVNGLIYQVRVGDYLGQNFGKVLRIGDTDIGLREIVQDTEGEWSERSASLQLTQGAK